MAPSGIQWHPEACAVTSAALLLAPARGPSSLLGGMVSAEPGNGPAVTPSPPSAPCVSLGHFGTAAGLLCQLVTGSAAGLTQVQKGEGGARRGGERTHMPPTEKTNSWFFPLISVESSLKKGEFASFSYSLCPAPEFFSGAGLGVSIEMTCADGEVGSL